MFRGDVILSVINLEAEKSEEIGRVSSFNFILQFPLQYSSCYMCSVSSHQIPLVDLLHTINFQSSAEVGGQAIICKMSERGCEHLIASFVDFFSFQSRMLHHQVTHNSRAFLEFGSVSPSTYGTSAFLDLTAALFFQLGKSVTFVFQPPKFWVVTSKHSLFLLENSDPFL